MGDFLASVTSRIREMETALGLDWRYSYVHARMEGSGTGVIELSSREIFEGLSRSGFGVAEHGEGGMELRGEGGTRVRVRLLAAPIGRALWVLSSVADIRREPGHAAELVNQAIMGEDADGLEAQGDWHLVRLRDGYQGWVRSWYLREFDRREIEAYRGEANVRVEASVAYIRSSPDEGSLPVSDIVAGSLLVAGEGAGGFRSVRLPDGRAGFIRESELGVSPNPDPPSREGIVERAQRYLGIPYIWGGTSPKGFDCSGLVKRVFEMEGVDLPRDTDRQALTGREIPLEEAGPGDLLFFGEADTISHVAIYLGAERYIHAYGMVRINALQPADPSFEPKLAASLKSARAILP